MEDFDNSTISTDQGLLQVKPETSRDEQMAFIDTMRGIQSSQNQEIQDATHALGSDVTPEFGGINGTNSYWLDRYQTPQTESRIATLRTAAQNSALNTALNNYLNRLQEDYNKAARRANKRQRQRALAAANSPTNIYDPAAPDVPLNPTDPNEGDAPDVVSATTRNLPSGKTYTTTKANGYTTQTDSKGNIYYTDNPNYTKASNGKYYNTSGYQTGNWIGNIVNAIQFGSKENLANWYAQHPDAYREYLKNHGG